MKKRLLLITACMVGFVVFLRWPRVRSSTAGNVSEISNPASPGSLAPSLSAAPEGEVVLSWLEPVGQEHSLRFSVRGQRGWGAVQTVVRRADFDIYAEAPPGVLKLENGSILAVWAQKRKGPGKWPGNYLYAAASQDYGKTWSTPARIHSDSSNSEHSFSSIAATGRDRATIIWLDARDNESKHRYRLMSAVVSSAGEVTDEKTVDNDVCTCCPTAFANVGSGGVAVYRGHTSDEIRDIQVARLVNGLWEQPHPVHDDQWKINGCPVNGPALSEREGRLAVVWFTGKNDEPRVQVTFSADSGKEFQPPRVLDSPMNGIRPVGHVGVALLDDGDALAVWLRQSSSGADLVAQHMTERGPNGAPFVVGQGTVRGLGYPRLRRLGHSALICWTAKDGKEVKTALIAPRGD